MLKRLFVVALCFAPALFAEQGNTKHYCAPHEIEIHDSMIVVHVDDEIFETDTLLSDQGGIYVLESSLRCLECRRGGLNPKNTCKYHVCLQT